MSDEPVQVFDVIVRKGAIYDGSGGEPYVADVAVRADRIAAIGRMPNARGGIEVDASGLAVAPGFINMLSHSYFSVLQDPRSLSELKQGVTLQVYGEGWSMGPYTEEMRQRADANQPPDLPHVDVTWTTLAGYMEYAEKRGVAQNFASYVGATTLRQYAVGADDRPATAAEMDVMCGLVRDEMSAGALGIGSSLIYPPAFFAPTEELVELCRASAPYAGKYISHMRSEGAALIEAVEELMRISRESGVPAEIYHLKAAGKENWPKIDRLIQMVEDARARGEPITADMYPYTAGATGLSNAIPPKYHDGGPRKLFERLADPAVRAQIKKEIETESADWENLYLGAGGADGVLILGVRKPEHRQYQGRRLADVAAMMGVPDPVDALMELVARDRSRVDTAYFIISADNVRKEIALPWVSFGSDSPSWPAEGAWLQRSTHPRAFGCFARVLGRYAQQERLLPLPEAVRRMTRFPAENLGLQDRGRIEEGYFADLVVFDAATMADRATYEEPQQYAEGVCHVFVNGVHTLRDGEATGAFAGRAVYGPGKR